MKGRTNAGGTGIFNPPAPRPFDKLLPLLRRHIVRRRLRRPSPPSAGSPPATAPLSLLESKFAVDGAPALFQSAAQRCDSSRNNFSKIPRQSPRTSGASPLHTRSSSAAAPARRSESDPAPRSPCRLRRRSFRNPRRLSVLAGPVGLLKRANGSIRCLATPDITREARLGVDIERCLEDIGS